MPLNSEEKKKPDVRSVPSSSVPESTWEDLVFSGTGVSNAGKRLLCARCVRINGGKEW